MASIEEQQKARRDLRRIEKAAERIWKLYDAQADVTLRQMDATEPGPAVAELRRRVDGLHGNMQRLERMMDDARSLDEWVSLDLRT